MIRGFGATHAFNGSLMRRAMHTCVERVGGVHAA